MTAAGARLQTGEEPRLWRGHVRRITGEPVIANLESPHSVRFLHLRSCFLVADWPEGEVTYVPDDDVDQLWRDAIANDGASTGLAYTWPWTDQVGWCPHCIVKQVTTDETPAAHAARKAQAKADRPPCGLPILHDKRLCGCFDDG